MTTTILGLNNSSVIFEGNFKIQLFNFEWLNFRAVSTVTTENVTCILLLLLAQTIFNS